MFLLQPVYCEVCSCVVQKPLKLTPLLVERKWVKVLVCFMSACLCLCSCYQDLAASAHEWSPALNSFHAVILLIPCHVWWAFWKKKIKVPWMHFKELTDKRKLEPVCHLSPSLSLSLRHTVTPRNTRTHSKWKITTPSGNNKTQLITCNVTWSLLCFERCLW